jgi:hypothetical protein
MNDVADSAARWLGILGSGVLVGEEAVRSARRAQQVLGREAVGDLRKWFDTLDPPSSLDAKCAVIELCVAMIHADRKITEAERALFDQIVERAELDTESADALRARLLAPPPLEAIIPRIPHPVLREVALLLAWQVAVADGRPRHPVARRHPPNRRSGLGPEIAPPTTHRACQRLAKCVESMSGRGRLPIVAIFRRNDHRSWTRRHSNSECAHRSRRRSIAT